MPAPVCVMAATLCALVSHVHALAEVGARTGASNSQLSVVRSRIDCPPGFFVTAPFAGKTGTEWHCGLCPAGKQSFASGLSAVCARSHCGHTHCLLPAGSMHCTTPRPTPAPTGGCKKGRYRPLPGLFCFDCPPGKFSPGGAGFAPCTGCPAGRYGLGASESSRCSGLCGAGRYGSGSSKSTSCSGVCASNRFGKSGATSSKCTGSCRTTASIPDKLEMQCKSKCAAGNYGLRTVGTCSKCPVGKFSQAASSTCTVCAAGKYTSVAGIGACTSCTMGHFLQQAGQQGCEACPFGKFTVLSWLF
jgi:hypothetical protein